MNIDSQALKKYQSQLKAKFTAKNLDPMVERLISLHVNRISDGVRFGLQNSRAYYAIDKAYDISQQQITPTLVKDLIDRNPGPDEVQNLAKSWGLDDMLIPVDDISKVTGKKMKGTNPKPGYLLQAPVFFQAFIPLLQSYVKIRWAKLFNDRDVYPLYKYESAHMGIKDRAIAKVVTQRVQRMSSEMGYRMVERDCIQKMLLYGQAISFPREPWYQEKQLIGGKTKVVKEGIRPETPHITRTFWDRSHPLYTLNTDTGVEYVGYWTMVPFREIWNNPNYWLPKDVAKQKKAGNEPSVISFPTGWRGEDIYTNLYRHLYPCVVAFPPINGTVHTVSPNERTKSMFNYTGDNLDDGIDITVMYHRLVPKDWGLYDYPHPVWHRFVYAGGQKVLYCEPVFYTPGIAYLYDYDGERARNSSLGFELMPFQDHLGNLISQYLLSVKKNLIRIVAVNKDVVGKDFRDKAFNAAENALRGIEVFEYSGQELRDQMTDIDRAFTPLPLQQQGTAEILGSINTIISILERLLGFSSQEVGASASHQQSATEVSVIAGSSSVRMAFTGSFVDDAIAARKRQLYYGLLHYSTDEFMVNLQEVTPGVAKVLKDAGFEVEEDSESPGIVKVSGSKKNLTFENMFSDRDGQSRNSDQQVALMLQAFLDRLMANPQVGQQLPLKYLFKFFNQVAEYIGLPHELKLPENPEQVTAEEQQQQVQQLTQLVNQIVEQTVAPAVEQVSQAVGQINQKVDAQGQAVVQVDQKSDAQDQQLAERQQNMEQSMMALLQKLDQLMSVQPPA